MHTQAPVFIVRFLDWVQATAGPFMNWCDLPGHEWAVGFALAWGVFLLLLPTIVVGAVVVAMIAAVEHLLRRA